MHYRKASKWGMMDRLVNPRALLIFNFGVDSSHLKPEHRQYLHEEAVPLLNWQNAVTIIGLCSRTGGTAHNLHLSQRRADRTLEFLRSQATYKFAALAVTGYGDLQAEVDGAFGENPRYRSVALMFEPGPVPPIPPSLFDLKPLHSKSDDLSPGESDLDLGKVIDVASGISGMMELLPWELVAAIGEYGDIATAVIGPIVGMYLLFKDVDELTEKNGKLEGFWDAMQSMADQYSEPALSTRGLRQWPALVEPVPRPAGPMDGDGLATRHWMEGRRIGRDAAYDMIQAMERNPKIKDGLQQTGRRFLFVLSQRFHSRVRDEIKSYINGRLHAQGKPPWPLH